MSLIFLESIPDSDEFNPSAALESEEKHLLNKRDSEYTDEFGNRITAVVDRPGDEPLVIYAEALDRETIEWLFSF
jgi:hypothetical protein